MKRKNVGRQTPEVPKVDENQHPNIFLELAKKIEAAAFKQAALEKAEKNADNGLTVGENSDSPRLLQIKNNASSYKTLLSPIVLELRSKTEIYQKKCNNMVLATQCIVSMITQNIIMMELTAYLIQWYEYYTAFLDQNYYYKCGHIIRNHHKKESEGFVHTRTKNYKCSDDDKFHLTIKSVDGYNAVVGGNLSVRFPCAT